MSDVFMPPDLAADIRAMKARIESLEMSSRAVRERRFVTLYGTTAALTPDASLLPQGAHAFYTDMGAFTNVLSGDFMSDGQFLYGSLYVWMPPAHTMEYEVKVREYGATAQTVLSGSKASTSEIVMFKVPIPDSAFISANRRDKHCRLDVNIRRTTGAGRVGIAVSGAPYVYPY